MRILIFFLLLFSMWASGQERVKGVVLSEEGRAISKVLIINIKTGAKFYTDEQGAFEIEAKVSEEIRGVKEGYERFTHIIKTSDFGQHLSFKMKLTETLINEVVITKLSKEKLADLQKSIGVPQVNWKVREKGKATQTKDVLLPLLAGALNLSGIHDLASGNARRKKNLYKYEDFQDNVDWIKNRSGTIFFIEKNIPEERISEFITFAITEKKEINQLIKAKNIHRIEKLLLELIPIYLKRLEGSE